MAKSRSGFTIVELLIVIVVIAILATISVVAYTGIQNRAHDSAVQNDLKSLATKLELFKVDSPTSVYPEPVLGLLTINFKATISAYQTSGVSHNLSYCFTTGYGNYTVVARSKSGTVYVISSLNTKPRVSSGTWDAVDPTVACNAAEPGIVHASNLRGYAIEDGWRPWSKGG